MIFFCTIKIKDVSEMKMANRVVTVFFCTVLFILSVITGGVLFVRNIDNPNTIQKVVQHLDLSDVLEDMNVSPSLKKALGNTVNSIEFKNIVSTYGTGFVTYLINGQTDIKVSHDQIEQLLTNHKDEILDNIPGGQYIPVDLIQSFLLDYVNIDDLLPKYSDLSSEIPIPVIRILRLASSDTLLGCLVILMIGSMGMIILVKKNILNSLKPIAISLYCSALFLFLLPIILQSMDVFRTLNMANIDQSLYLLLKDFNSISIQVLLVSVLINLIDIFLKRKKVK